MRKVETNTTKPEHWRALSQAHKLGDLVYEDFMEKEANGEARGDENLIRTFQELSGIRKVDEKRGKPYWSVQEREAFELCWQRSTITE